MFERITTLAAEGAYRRRGLSPGGDRTCFIGARPANVEFSAAWGQDMAL